MLVCKDKILCQKILPFLIVFLTISSSIGLEISAPSLVSIKNYFNSTEKTVGLTMTLFFLGVVIMSFFYGPISDHLGRRKILIFGLNLACFGGVLTVFGKNIETLLLGRFIQGLGTAAAISLTPVIIADIFKEKATRFMRINLGLTTIFTAIGPLIGGFVNNAIGFRANYLIILLLQLFALFIIYIFFQESLIFEKNHDKKINLIKIFVRLYNAIKTKDFLACLLIPTILYSSFLGFVSYAAFLYIETFGLTDVQYSINQTIIVLCFSITNLLFGFIKYNHQIWDKRLILFSSGLIFLSYFLILFSKNQYSLTFLISIAICGHAVLSPFFFAKLFSLSKERGSVSSVVGVFRSVLMVFFTWFAVAIYDGSVFNIGLILFSSFLIVLFCISILFRSQSFYSKFLE